MFKINQDKNLTNNLKQKRWFKTGGPVVGTNNKTKWTGNEILSRKF